MKRITLTLFVALLCAGAIAQVFQNRKAKGLSGELSALRHQKHELSRLQNEKQSLLSQQASKEEMERLSTTEEEQVQLQAELDRLRQSTSMSAPPAEANKDWPPLAPGMIPAASLRHAGNASPEAAVQSVLWAIAQLDLDALSTLIQLSPGGREKVAKLYDVLNATQRSQYRSVEDLTAVFLAAAYGRFSGSSMKGPEFTELNRAVETIDLQMRTGRRYQVPLDVQNNGGAWKVVVPDQFIDTIVMKVQQPRKTSP